MRGKWNNAGKNILKNDLLTRHFFVWVGVWQRAMLLLCNQICQWRLACHTRGRFVYAATIINCNANGFGTVITWLRKKESRGVEALRMYICMGGSQQSVMLWPSRLAWSQMFRINICLQPLDSWIWKETRHPTNPFTILELQNQSHDVPELHNIRQSPDLEALKLWKCTSGSEMKCTYLS